MLSRPLSPYRTPLLEGLAWSPDWLPRVTSVLPNSVVESREDALPTARAYLFAEFS